MTARRAYFAGREATSVSAANVLVVVGGCFAALWGDSSIGRSAVQEDWRLADRDPLTNPAAVAQWLLEHSRLPADILRRLSPEPLILQPMNPAQAEKVAAGLCDNLPPSFDGLGTQELSSALQSPHGWRAAAALIEQTWVDGHQSLLEPQTEAPIPTMVILPPEPLEVEPFTAPPPMRLGELLGIPSNRSTLMSEARRLGLHTNSDFQRLAIARGYTLPGEDLSGTTNAERVGRDTFSDDALMAALLSPCLDWSEETICRGARLLATRLAVVGDPSFLLYDIRRARGALIVRHVALIGLQLYPQLRRWRDMLSNLPSTLDEPVFEAGVMPDAAIHRVLSTPLS